MHLENYILEIPQFEIQSTAFSLFLEGHLGFAEQDTNLWLSIPLANLKRRDVAVIPKTGFAEAGKKVYIEVVRLGETELEFKLHLTNKKLYKQRGEFLKYRDNLKTDRQLRRQHKRAARQTRQHSN